ncbi:MAG: M1 family metallopeptidase [Planctomycetota bacterium]
MKSTAVLALAVLAACQALPAELRPSAAPTLPMDIHSHAEPNRVRVTHVDLTLALEFARKQAQGTAMLTLERSDMSAPLVLDSKGLEIESVTGSDGTPRRFELSPEDARIGSALTIVLTREDHRVKIAYHTTERSDALQWLAPEQTADGAAPYLFTQGQAILTRTWIPLQDSPGVRVTYEAHITAPSGLTAVMSAEQLGRGEDGAFHFRMTNKIPPYLIALACGRIEFRAISDRCGVWAEPSVVEKAQAEFSDTEKMVDVAEDLFGRYRWGRYDVIILPPSFPFGGMENPRLTFATPTIMAGDKSLVSLIAHELAHSWSGNLVTNATWRDFWLNEGFTVYFEQRIMEEVYGVERADMEKELSLGDLEREMKELAPRDQVLHIDLAGRHPDDALTEVAYTKGALFLSRLEEVFGRRRFDRFLTSYFNTYAFDSITTEEFVTYLKRNLLNAQPERAAKIDLDAWLNQPGLPIDTPRVKSAQLSAVDLQVEKFKQSKQADALQAQGWVTQQWLHFLEGIADTVDATTMARLDNKYQLSNSGNSEIQCVWLRLAIKTGYGASEDKLEQFLMTVGRRKFLKPLYTELAKTDEGMKRARAIYVKARPRYHAVSTGTIDKILGLAK